MASIKKDLKTNLYHFVLDAGKHPDGRRKQIRRKGFKTKKEAEKALAELLNEVEKGDYVDSNNITIKEFVLNWVEDKKKSIVIDTYNNYKSYINSQIIPYIGQVEVQKLTPMMYQKYINDLHESGLAGASIRRIHNILKSALSKAVTWGIISKNATTMDIDLPREEKKDLTVWDFEDVEKFLFVTQDSKYHLIYLLAVTTGMRQGEILGLRWKDVDYDKGVLYVTQVLSHDGKTFKPGTKTKAGYRSIHLFEEIVEALKKRREKVDYEKKFHKDQYNDLDLVNCTEIGNPIHPNNLWDQYKRTIKKHGLPEITFHDLRHTHASLLLKQNVHPKVVQERLGHANIGITMNTYSHLFPSMQKEAAQDFGKVLFKREN